jgi:uncharacterized SAM-binding protein YcdF (DUF218 family)
MFFVFAKLFEIVTQPGNLLVLLLALGVLLLVFGARRSGLALVAAITIAFLAVMVLPLGEWASVALERRFPQPDLPQRVDGIILLGGAINVGLTKANGQVALNGMADRITETLALAQRYRDAAVLISGGDASLIPQGLTEAVVTRSLLVADGLDERRILIEDRSRDTYENAVYSKAVANPRPGQTWLLVTSANHMPRAVGCFRHVGFDVMPYPVDYNSGTNALFSGNFASDLHTLGWATHEWLGLVAYRLMGRTDTLFPAPGPISATSAR